MGSLMLYGLKQAALAFWSELLKALRHMKYERSKADPCLYYKWKESGIQLWISWVDDCLTAGKKKGFRSQERIDGPF